MSHVTGIQLLWLKMSAVWSLTEKLTKNAKRKAAASIIELKLGTKSEEYLISVLVIEPNSAPYAFLCRLQPQTMCLSSHSCSCSTINWTWQTPASPHSPTNSHYLLWLLSTKAWIEILACYNYKFYMLDWLYSKFDFLKSLLNYYFYIQIYIFWI